MPYRPRTVSDWLYERHLPTLEELEDDLDDPNPDERTSMSRLTTLNASIGNLRREIERDRLRVDDRQQELDDAIAEHARLTNQLRGLGNDNEYEIGAILTFDKYFTHDGIQYGPYTYAAVKTAIHGNSQYRYMGSTAWFTSGPKAPGPYTWEQMLAFLSEGVHEVWLADTAKRIWVAR